jgi:hypothetical protein
MDLSETSPPGSPESEEHNRLVGDLFALQGRIDDHTANKLIDQGAGDMVSKLLRLSLDEDNRVTLPPSPEDPDYSSDHLPDPLTDEEMARLINEGTPAIERAEKNT